MTQDQCLQQLSAMFGERLITSDTGSYDSARGLWNGAADKRPWAIVRCVSAAEVGAAIRIARDAGRPLSVRGGGHQIAGGAIVDDGLVIDLQLMRYADVDLRSRTVRVGGGSLLGDLDRACARFGVVVPAGVVSHTGVGGLTLGGGIGWLCRSRGLTCDNLVSATVVLADGSVVVASATEHADLHWALRGGGGSFGIVTEFVFAVSEIGPVVRGTRTIALAYATEAMMELGNVTSRMPRELQFVMRLQRSDHATLAPTGPGELVLEWLWSGAMDDSGSIETLMDVGPAVAQTANRCRFIEVQGLQDDRFPHGSTYYMKPGHLEAIGGPQVEALVSMAEGLPMGDSQIEIMRLGGAVSDPHEDSAAFPRRDAAFAFNVIGGRAHDLGDYEAQVDWVQRAHAALSAVGPIGAYSNFAAGTGVSLEDVFGASKLSRLRSVKRIYDPNDVLRPPLHIVPEDVPLRETTSA